LKLGSVECNWEILSILEKICRAWPTAQYSPVPFLKLALGHTGLEWAGPPGQFPLRARLGVIPTARQSRPPALRPDRASCRSDARHLPPGLHAQHMQPPSMCTALRLTHCPYPLDAEAKPRLPSPLPRNTAPLPSPVHAPPLCTDDVRLNQITAQEHHLPVVEPCSPLATSSSL
jgi:hypothetical protein